MASLRIAILALVALGCARSPTTVATRDVDPAARTACSVADTLLRRLPHMGLHDARTLSFDSVWHDTTGRMACQVSAAGVGDSGFAVMDSTFAWLRARGWTDRAATISADGPDGTDLGFTRETVTCLAVGQWDGGDDSDSPHVPSDSMEVTLSCTRLLPEDTLLPLWARPGSS